MVDLIKFKQGNEYIFINRYKVLRVREENSRTLISLSSEKWSKVDEPIEDVVRKLSDPTLDDLVASVPGGQFPKEGE